MRFPDLEAAFSYLESFTNFEKITPQSVRDFKQDRMHKLLDYFGRPEQELTLFHIAGSKGKGSTGIFLASMLKTGGLRTGLYTSPHVVTYRERISEAGVFFDDVLYLEAIEKIADMVESGAGRDLAGDDGDPTTFELLTLLAFLVFRAAGCTHGVIETGIGGRLDATNCISPAASIITPIELEHTDILGETIEEIAREKAGIIKGGIPVFSAYQTGSVAEILKETAGRLDSEITFLEDEVFSLSTHPTLAVEWSDGTRLEAVLSMLGDVQGENAALAVTVLKKLGLYEPESAVRGLKKAVLPGRMERIGSSPPLILDGAHTPSSLKRVCETFRKTFPKEGICIYGNVSGKRIEEMAKIAAAHFKSIIVSTPGTFKKSDPGSVYKAISKYHSATLFLPEPKDALKEALRLAGKDLPILVTGSFYMIGEIKKLLYTVK